MRQHAAISTISGNQFAKCHFEGDMCIQITHVFIYMARIAKGMTSHAHAMNCCPVALLIDVTWVQAGHVSMAVCSSTPTAQARSCSRPARQDERWIFPLKVHFSRAHTRSIPHLHPSGPRDRSRPRRSVRAIWVVRAMQDGV